jgi:hypothetical protein
MINEEHFFSFNENKKFKNFIAIGTEQFMNNSVICYDDDYMKIWDTNLGNSKLAIDS